MVCYHVLSAGVMKIIEDAAIDLQGKKAVVIGRSRIVGMPLALLLAQKALMPQ